MSNIAIFPYALKLVEDCDGRNGGCEGCPKLGECVKKFDRICDITSLTRYYKTNPWPVIGELEEVINA